MTKPERTISSAPPPGVVLVESQAAFDDLMQELSGAPLLALDTEAASFHRYHDRIYLIQVSSRELSAIIDPLAVPEMSALGRLMADPVIEIVFHDADYDLRLFDREYGFHATNLFDTRIAAQLLNEPGIGLAALLEKYFSLRLNKKYQRADWSLRPLSTEMLAYAASDTQNLPELRDILRGRLESMGRLAWAEEEFRHLEQVRWTPPVDSEPGYLRLKGAKALRGRALAVLREVFEWREGLAKRGDKAAFRIINNEPMLAMAKNPPKDLAELKAIPGVGHDLLERRGRDLLAAVQRGLDLPDNKLPRIERPPRRAPDPECEARMDRLKAARNRIAAAMDLAPGVLCPNGTLEAIARANPAGPDELAQLPELRHWQAETIGDELLVALRTPSPSSSPDRVAG